MKTTKKFIEIFLFVCFIGLFASCSSSKMVSDEPDDSTNSKNILPPDVKSNKYSKSRNLS